MATPTLAPRTHPLKALALGISLALSACGADGSASYAYNPHNCNSTPPVIPQNPRDKFKPLPLPGAGQDAGTDAGLPQPFARHEIVYAVDMGAKLQLVGAQAASDSGSAFDGGLNIGVTIDRRYYPLP